MKACFTGPRPKNLYGYEKEKYLPLIDTLKGTIREFINQGYDTFITGGAQGVDQLAFWAVHALKKEGYNIKNIVYAPFKGQELGWAKEGLFSQKEYSLMLKLADEVCVLKEIDVKNRGQVVDALYHRNHQMVDGADTTVGIYPDYGWQFFETKSGTAECLRYAKDQGKAIFQLSPETLKGQWMAIEQGFVNIDTSITLSEELPFE